MTAEKERQRDRLVSHIPKICIYKAIHIHWSPPPPSTLEDLFLEVRAGTSSEEEVAAADEFQVSAHYDLFTCAV